MSVIIQTAGLTKRYGSLTAVDGLSVTVEKQEIYGFLGLNGAGKTTTIRMLLGLVRPSGGVASVLGSEIGNGIPGPWGRVGYLVEMPNAYPELTVRENLEVFRRLRSPLEPKAVDFAIERLGLERYADRPASTLSLGNAQRLGLAKALLHKPQLLILDEPSNGLDPAGIVEVRNLLNELSTEHGVTVFLSSHLLGEVARLATRIGIIHNGRLLTERNVNEVERERRTRLVCSTRADEIAVRLLAGAGFDVTMNGDGVIEVHNPLAHEHPDQVARVLVDLGYPPTMLKVEREDLETYFLRLVGMEDRHAGEKR